MSNLTDKQELFCQGIAKYGRKKKVLAYTEAGYSTNMSENALGVAADQVYQNPNISLRIDELMEKVEKIAEEKFSISVEWRLQALKNIHDAGVSQYKDGNDTARYENLAASNAAIKTMNEMLGTGDDKDDTGEAIAINFTVNPAVRDVKVVRSDKPNP